MKTVDCKIITETVARLCAEANIYAGADITGAIAAAAEGESLPIARNVLDTLLKNAAVARDEGIPICQDTGMAVIFVTLGQDVHITGGNLCDALNEGVRRGYRENFLRMSVVRDPVDRVNTGDNTPAVIHFDIVPGEIFEITAAPKGFGSENMSALKMLTPSDGLPGIERFVLDTVTAAGSNPCPPVIVGVGTGGTMEKAALLAKRALLRTVGSENPDGMWREFERAMLQKINASGIGPGGFGGRTTALAVHAEVFPTHIAGLPVAVNIGCHVTRHMTAAL